jgi:mRNA-degrading endonuclease toxin of MazEF toxin-antitoxin module
VSNLCRGRIVRVEVLDPQNRNPKCRPAVILTPTEEIRLDGDVVLVAITGSVNAAPAEMQVALPWQAQGQTATRLTKPSVAVCTWVFTSPVTKIQSSGGIVPDRQMLLILDKINALAPPPPDTPPANPSIHTRRN